jgi:hypothetical protein
LVGLDRIQLVERVSAPDEEEEPVYAVIWQLMDELIKHCQYSVIHERRQMMGVQQRRQEVGKVGEVGEVSEVGEEQIGQERRVIQM